MNLIVRGLHVAGSDSGHGPVALLLHGWGTDHTSLMNLAPTLAGYRVLAPDLPGFGGSQPPTEAWDVVAYAKFVIDLLEKAGIQELDLLLGHSFGGRIALELVGRDMLKPKKLVLLASHGLPEKLTPRQKALAAGARFGKLLPQSLRQRIGGRFGSPDYRATSGVMRQIFKNVIAQDATNSARNIHVPTLFIYGAVDDTTPPSMGHALHERVEGSRLEVVDQAGHYVQIDQPEVVNQLVKEFIA